MSDEKMAQVNTPLRTVELSNGTYTIVNQYTPIVVFVLSLQHDCFVVGQTLKRQFTYDDLKKECYSIHALRPWLEEHLPINVHYLYANCTLFDEDKIVKMFMYKYGINNVRGGSMATLDTVTQVLIMKELQWVKAKEQKQQSKPFSKPDTPILQPQQQPPAPAPSTQSWSSYLLGIVHNVTDAFT